MSVTIGTQLGSLEILSLLGRGGMGEVYRARDTKLKREVAIKILPDEFSGDPDRVGRFQREAEVLASLNHPNIAAIYELQEANGSRFLVLELVEGETLAERIKRGPIPIDEALNIAKSICEALEAAHEKGVIHRDLKPANVKVTPEGKVKVLDFGLAKAFAGDSAASAPPPVIDSNSPTLSRMPEALGGAFGEAGASPTLPGVILGTAAYMSPEQAKGKAVDRRTDIWALGCVLYELLTARPAFSGDSVTEILGAVMRGEPDWSLLPEATPPAIRALLRRCLRKDLQQRPRDAADIRLELDDARAAASAAAPLPALAPSGNKLRERLAWGVAGVALAAAGILAYTRFQPASTTVSNAIRFSVSAPGNSEINGQQLAVSPDGTRVVFPAANRDGGNVLWVRSLDSPEARSLAGTEGAETTFWSPDGEWIGFTAGNKLKTISATGGAVQTLANASSRGATWNREGTIVFTSGIFSGLQRISNQGGPSSPVTTLNTAAGERGHRWPMFLPDGRHFLYHSLNTDQEKDGVYVGSLDSKETTLLLRTNHLAAYAAPGYLLFMRERNLMAQPLDAGSLKLSGEPALIADSLWVTRNTGQAGFSVSNQNVLAYWSGGALGTVGLAWFDRTGKALGTVAGPGGNSTPRLSPDGKRLAITRDVDDIYLIELERGVITTRFTFDPAVDRNPVWSPDGSQIIFHSNRKGLAYDLYRKSSSGAGTEELLFQSSDTKYPRDWSRDGRFLVYSSFPVGTQQQATADLWVLPLTGEKKPFPFLQTKFEETQPQLSPEGKWIVYVSNESGRDEVYVQSFPTPGSKRQISVSGGRQPRWRDDGKELFYLSPDRKLMAVPVSAGQTLEAGTPEPLFQTPFATPVLSANSAYNYDVAAGGQRFLMFVPPGDSTVPITVVLNWTAALKK